MRFSKATATGAAAVLIAALLAGCSNQPQGSQTLPASAGAGAGQSVHFGAPQIQNQKWGKLSPMAMLKLQANGKMLGPVPAKQAQKILDGLKGHKRPHFTLPARKGGGGGGSVAIWSSLPYDGYLLGETSKGTSTIADINTDTEAGSDYCYDPFTIKIDASQNIWTACEDMYNSSTGTEGIGMAEYTKSGSSAGDYPFGCPGSFNGCGDYFYAYGFDGAANSSYTFDSLEYYYGYDCPTSGSCEYTDGLGFEYWPTGSPTSPPTLIALPYDSCNSSQPICFYDMGYMDLDSSGNIWFNYEGYDEDTGTSGFGIAEMLNPTSPSRSIKSIEPPGFLEYWGGVYTSNGGTVVNVGDQDTLDIYQFNTSGSETRTLGKVSLFGDPIGFGFNAASTDAVVGDCSLDWTDIGVVNTNKWKPAKSPYDFSCVGGAAYTPSDK